MRRNGNYSTQTIQRKNKNCRVTMTSSTMTSFWSTVLSTYLDPLKAIPQDYRIHTAQWEDLARLRAVCIGIILLECLQQTIIVAYSLPNLLTMSFQLHWWLLSSFWALLSSLSCWWCLSRVHSWVVWSILWYLPSICSTTLMELTSKLVFSHSWVQFSSISSGLSLLHPYSLIYLAILPEPI